MGALPLASIWYCSRRYSSNSTYFSDYYDQQNYGFAVSLRKPIGELDYVKLEYRCLLYTSRCV